MCISWTSKGIDTERIYSAVRSKSLNIIKFKFLHQPRREIFSQRMISSYSIRGLLLSPAVHTQEWLKRPDDVDLREVSAPISTLAWPFVFQELKRVKLR